MTQPQRARPAEDVSDSSVEPPATLSVVPRRVTPFVKWAGGKTNVLEALLPLVPPVYGRYFEPFLGGGALYFALQPASAVLGDSNEELVTAYRVVRDAPDDLMAALDAHVYDEQRYYAVRAQDPATLSPVERAARFIYLNKTCYNGLYRVNRRGEFNVPFGRYKTPPKLYDRENLLGASALLQSAEIHCATFDHTLQSARAGDFVYLDPPYWPLDGRASFTSYSADRFGQFDQQWLKAQFDRLHERGCAVMLSNSDTPFARWLYDGFVIDTVLAPRAINADPSGRQCVTEIVVRNYGQPRT